MLLVRVFFSPFFLSLYFSGEVLMEEFLPITTFSRRDLANRACANLEDIGVPIMLEHIEIIEDGAPYSAYRLLVPTAKRQTALRVVESTLRSQEINRAAA